MTFLSSLVKVLNESQLSWIISDKPWTAKSLTLIKKYQTWRRKLVKSKDTPRRSIGTAREDTTRIMITEYQLLFSQMINHRYYWISKALRYLEQQTTKQKLKILNKPNIIKTFHSLIRKHFMTLTKLKDILRKLIKMSAGHNSMISKASKRPWIFKAITTSQVKKSSIFQRFNSLHSTNINLILLITQLITLMVHKTYRRINQ
jgi:hypothetical protein